MRRVRGRAGAAGMRSDVRPPFAADAHALALDFVTVFCRLRRRGVPLYGAGPDAAVGVLQGDAPLAEAEYELFAPAGTVFDADQEFHGIGLWEVLIGTWGVGCLFAESKITKIIE